MFDTKYPRSFQHTTKKKTTVSTARSTTHRQRVRFAKFLWTNGAPAPRRTDTTSRRRAHAYSWSSTRYLPSLTLDLNPHSTSFYSDLQLGPRSLQHYRSLARFHARRSARTHQLRTQQRWQEREYRSFLYQTLRILMRLTPAWIPFRRPTSFGSHAPARIRPITNTSAQSTTSPAEDSPDTFSRSRTSKDTCHRSSRCTSRAPRVSIDSVTKKGFCVSP